jgi:putative oxidoreductase
MTFSDLGLLILRIVVGLTMAGHGAQKAFGWWKGPGRAGWYAVMVRMGFRPANAWGLVSIGAELVGGILFALGLFTPVAATALIGQAVVIIFKAHWSRGFWGRDGGYEFPLSLVAGVVAVLGTGAGAVSLDSALGLAYPVEVRAALLAIGVFGGAAAILVSRVAPAASSTEAPS